MKAGLMVGWCLAVVAGLAFSGASVAASDAGPVRPPTHTLHAATPGPTRIKSSSMAPSGHPKKHYGAPIQQPILKHVAPKPKVKSAPQLKSTPLPAQTPAASSPAG
jgi:hypothetical protein